MSHRHLEVGGMVATGCDLGVGLDEEVPAGGSCTLFGPLRPDCGLIVEDIVQDPETAAFIVVEGISWSGKSKAYVEAGGQVRVTVRNASDHDIRVFIQVWGRELAKL